MYDHTPMALIDIMLADLPRVEYTDNEKITKEDIDEANRKTEEIQKRVKERGLGISIKNKVDTNAYVQSKMKKGV